MGSQTPLDELTPDVPIDDGTEKGKAKESPTAAKRRRAASARSESELRGRLSACLERIAVSLETRGDEELAEIIREDAEIMSVGLVSLTRPFKALRAPLQVALAIVEPAMAFGRLIRALAERAAMRRAMNAQMQQEPSNGSDGSNGV